MNNSHLLRLIHLGIKRGVLLTRLGQKWVICIQGMTFLGAESIQISAEQEKSALARWRLPRWPPCRLHSSRL